MADHSAIEWTDATWNPLRGCSRVSAGCQHCYAERVASRFSGPGMPYEGLIHPSTKGWNGKVRFVPEVLDQPLRWKKQRRIFVNSMSDLFHESVPFEWIDQIFAVMAFTPQHTFQVLTKRPDRMRAYLSYLQRLQGAIENTDLCRAAQDDVDGFDDDKTDAQLARTVQNELALENVGDLWNGKPLPNVWIGVSVENQATADERIPLLLQCPAAVRWLSCEPLLGPVDLNYAFGIPSGAGRGSCPMHLACIAPEGLRPLGEQHLHWVVTGGESGPAARPMHPDWARSLRDQCAAAGVPFFFKQWGEWLPWWQFTDELRTRVTEEHDPYRNAGWVQDTKSWELTDGPVAMCDCEPEQMVAKVGKRAAGRLLDGVEHNAYPVAAR